MSTSREIVLEVPFCGGRLMMWRQLTPMRYYDDHEAIIKAGVAFLRDDKELEVRSTEMLQDLAVHLGYSLEDQVATDAAGFASMCGDLLKMGRVVSNSDLYDFIGPKFRLRLADHRPRVVDHGLRFLIACFSLDQAPFLFDVTVDLRTGAVSKSVIREPALEQWAELDTLVDCPACGQRSGLRQPLQFQWGEIPHTYHAGDAVVWLRNRSGEIIPSHQLAGPDCPWNRGDPAVRDLYAFRRDRYSWPFACSHCGDVFDTVAAQITGGVFRGAVAFRLDDVERLFGAAPGTFDIAVLRPDGTYEPRPDWYDAPFSEYKGQWP